MKSTIQFFHTVKYLLWIQWIYRLWYKLFTPSLVHLQASKRFLRAGTLYFIPKKPAYCADDIYVFLNKKRNIKATSIWQDKTAGLLWLYHLHYFDDINAPDALGKTERDTALIIRWLRENTSARGVGFEPYPTSLRIVNWIKWCLKGNTPPYGMHESLCQQTALLAQRIEYAIMGNHLLANAKALIFSGLFFEGKAADAWLLQGLSLLSAQIEEQFLAEGAHFELSPMYHAILFEDILDIIALGSLYDYRMPAILYDIPLKLQWLMMMTHPCGAFAHFNDTVQGASASTQDLINYAARLGFDIAPFNHFANTALDYARLTQGSMTLIADLADVRATYQPGHTHADTLSFELSIGKQRIFVNTGTSEYGCNLLRHYERSTPAHNTLSVDNQNICDVWHNFRVGRRAYIVDRVLKVSSLFAAYIGFPAIRGGIEHQRHFDVKENVLTITDIVLGKGEHLINQFFNLLPGIDCIAMNTHIFDIHHLLQIAFDTKVAVHVRSSEHSSGFGHREPCKKIITEVQTHLPVTLVTTVKWHP